MRAAYLAHMQYSEFNRHMEELGQTGRAVVDDTVINKCEKCGQAVVEGEGHHCLLPRKHYDYGTASNSVRGIERHVSIAGKTTGRYSKSALGFVQNLAEKNRESSRIQKEQQGKWI